MQERLRREEEQEFDLLPEYFYLIRDEICHRIYWSWEEIQLRNAFHQVWNETPFPKIKARRLFLGPLPLILPIPAEMLQLNWLQRWGKVFWKLQNRRV